MQPYMTNQAQYHTGPIHQEIKVAGANVKDRYLQLKDKHNPNTLCREQFKIAEDPQRYTKILDI